MKLQTIIKKKLDSLYKEYNKFNKQVSINKEIIEKLDIYNFRDKSLLNLTDEELDLLLSTIYKNEELNKKSETIRLIKVVLIGKYENNFDINLTKEQDEVLIKLIHDIKILYNKIDKQQKYIDENTDKVDILEENILELEDIIEKIILNYDLTENDFNILYKLIVEDEKIDFQTKKELLLQFKNYNNKINNNLEIKITDDLLTLFNSYNLNITFDDLNEFKNEIQDANLEEIKEILDILSKEKILKRFDKLMILAICLYSNVDIVKERVEYIKEQNYMCNILFHKANLWVNNLNSRFNNHNNKLIYEFKKGKNKTLHSITKQGIGLSEIKENEKYLQSEGFDIDINTSKNEKVLARPNYLLRENIEAYKLYGLLNDNTKEKFPLSALWFGDLTTKLDMFIELGLLNGVYPTEYSSYVNNVISSINTIKNTLYPILFKIKQENNIDKYYESLSQGESNIYNDLKKILISYNLNTKEELEEFINNNFINLEDTKYFKYKLIYDEIIKNSNRIDYDPNIINEEILEYLENDSVKKNNFIYEINGRYISRLKVLRILSILKENGIKLDKECLIYAITRNTFMNEKTLDMISNYIGYNYKGEYNNGLSKNI